MVICFLTLNEVRPIFWKHLEVYSGTVLKKDLPVHNGNEELPEVQKTNKSFFIYSRER